MKQKQPVGESAKDDSVGGGLQLLGGLRDFVSRLIMARIGDTKRRTGVIRIRMKSP